MRWAVAVLVMSLLVACSGGKHHARPSTTTTSTAPSTTTTTPPPTTHPGPPPCTTAGLDISAGQGGAAAGHEGLPVLFKNTATKCRITGYPGVAGLDSAGRQATQAQRSPSGYIGGLPFEDQTPPIVDLAPGETASALVEGTSVPTDNATSCPSYPALLVTPPGETHSVTVAAGLPGCSPLQVHPVVPGVTGSIRQ